ncbi:hypothetical protein ACFSSC_05870 [Corynebacterium mendelii]|uniref:Secreted protein n=1 Tax=Corynebacterium mendelii TaxID=2765362 RepID=A0A939IW62_9CORY|nr:hypothetical protein [Corynebacterium mendelii]MBN9643070.1 hypothetical protein [Corynebacterium mendelii]
MRTIRNTTLALATTVSLIGGSATVAVADEVPATAVRVAAENTDTHNAAPHEDEGSAGGYEKPLILAGVFIVLIGAIVTIGDMVKEGTLAIPGITPAR